MKLSDYTSVPTGRLPCRGRPSVVIGLLACGLMAAVLVGCEQRPPQMSYEDALRIYTAEVELLNSLKSQRSQLATSLSQLSASGGLDVAQVVGGLAQGAAETQDQLQQQLDQFPELQGIGPKTTAGSEEGDVVADSTASPGADLLGQLANQAQQFQTQQAERQQEIESELAKLDEQIATQQAKVDRALADKEKAESRR